jgi:hypothetical protein
MDFDKDSCKVVATRPVCAKGSVTDKNPETRSILGVLLFRVKTSKEWRPILIGKFFPNGYLKTPNSFIFCTVIDEQFLARATNRKVYRLGFSLENRLLNLASYSITERIAG